MMSRTTSSGQASVRLLCAAFDLSTQAYYAARRPRILRAAARRERAGPWATAAEVEAAGRRLCADNPAWGVRKIHAVMRREGIVASRRRTWAVMRAQGLVLPPPERREGPALRGHVVVPGSNRRWATDMTTVWTRLDGVVAVSPAVDCGDRFLLALGVSRSQEAPALLAPVRTALVEAFGAPGAVPDGLEVRTDHGPQYTGADMAELCGAWSLLHTLAPVGRPSGNAVAERLIQTMKLECVWTRDWKTIAEPRTELEAWRTRYDHKRPHQALDWLTPGEKRAKNLAARASRVA